MSQKQLDTLVEDIFALFDPKVTHVPDEANVEEYGEKFKELLRHRLKEREVNNDALRFSSLGKKDRQLWYTAKGYEPEEMTAKTYFKFLYGDVIELLVLFLAKEAGHAVEREQEEIDVDGIKGHIDAVIDGVVVDVKSASPFGYQKFEKQTVTQDDVFGYTQQLSGYANVLTPGEGAAWVAFDKVSGDICVSPISSSIISDYEPLARINHLRGVIARDEPPERCYPDVEDGKSGNRKLGTGCSYCSHKHRCWADANGGRGLRTFLYGNGPRFLTQVGKTPDVPEVQEAVNEPNQD